MPQPPRSPEQLVADAHREMRYLRRLATVCVFATLVSVVIAAVSGSTSISQQDTVLENRDRGIENRKLAKAAPKIAKKEAVKVAEREARRTRTVVLRRARTIVRRQVVREVGRRGAMGRLPTLAETRAAVADLCASGACTFPVTVEVVVLALRQCIADGGCGALRGDAGAKGDEGDPAPGMTIEEQDAMWARNCARYPEVCKGDTGDTGPQGPAGMLQPCVTQDPNLAFACVPAPPREPPEPPPTVTAP